MDVCAYLSMMSVAGTTVLVDITVMRKKPVRKRGSDVQLSVAHGPAEADPRVILASDVTQEHCWYCYKNNICS